MNGRSVTVKNVSALIIYLLASIRNNMSVSNACSSFNIATAIVSICIIFYLWAKYKQTYWSRRGVYSSPAHWFFGHFREVFFLRASPPHILGELHRTCVDQPVVGVYILQKPFLLLRDNEIIKRILVKDFHVFPDRYFAAKRKTDVVGSASLFSIDNPQWKYLRIKLSPGFTSGKQKKLFNLMLESAENMRNHLESRVSNSQELTTIEARGVSNKYTTDVISSLSFGIKTNSFDVPEPEFYVRSRDIFKQSVVRTYKLFANFFFPKINDFISSGFLDPHTDYFRQIFWESMNEREKSNVKRGDIIDLLLQLKNEQQSQEFTFRDDYLLAQSAIFFVAGLETSAITMCFTLMELARHPDIQDRVHEELSQKLGNEKLTYERISDMHYLQQVINETLRLYPPAPLLDRIAVEDYKIPGTDITIEKGTVVYAVLTGIHNDPRYHSNPTSFDPDRFSEERKQFIKPCTYMPFGEGPRICIGQRTGALQTMVGLITILREYQVSWNPMYNNEVSKRAIFTAPSSGVHLDFTRLPVSA